MSTRTSIALFQAFGVELEYMIVDADTLDVRPITDQLLFDAAGDYVSDFESGDISWSNELVLHVVELKTTDPAAELAPLSRSFQREVERINRMLEPHGAMLMPSAMHPWMNPDLEMRLWPHDDRTIYETFHRIFNCGGHGWANLQSVHLNLPFAGDDQFGRLHTAIRLLLPILPALAAASPLVEGRLTGTLDNRLDYYRSNSRRVPSVCGQVIPEPVASREEYERTILRPIYDDLAPLDPHGVLRHEWANARGAIARFMRDTIEIRVLDVQECPRADLAICAAVTAVLKALTDGRWTSCERQRELDTDTLHAILREVIRDADQAPIIHADYLTQFGVDGPGRDHVRTAGDLWRYLLDATGVHGGTRDGSWRESLGTITRHGPLARRIARAVGPQPDRERMRAVYRQLCACLQHDQLFVPHG
jgi:glutamate---cysteine ligase / carboxylate-amine ligase